MGQIIDTDGLALYDQEYVMPLINSVAPVENSQTASQAYSEGDELILNNILYKAISAIAQGGDLIPSGTGQNIDLAGTIVSQLKALFDDETVLKRANSLSNLNITDASLGALSWYAVQANSQYSPFSSQGYLLNFQRNTSSGDISLQIAIPNDGSAIYLRTKDVSSWPTTGTYGWKQIYGDWIDKSSSVVKAEANSLVTLYINPALKLGCMFGYIYTPSNVSSWTNAFTLPTGARPKSTLFFHAGGDTNMQIGPSGGALYIGASNESYKYFNAVYPLA